MTVVRRFRDDATPPRPAPMVRDLLVRGLAPMLALIMMGLAAGSLVTGRLSGWLQEDRLNRALQQGRSPLLDEIARSASAIGGVSGNIAICIVATAIVLLVGRQWWLACVPVVALNLHTFVHLTTSTLVGRDRPGVEQLDVGQPTASFPSGHMGATTAQLLVLLLFASSFLPVRRWRVLLAVITAGYLIVLGWSRLYLGMHHVTDVAWGVVNGIACGLAGWMFLRRSPRAPGEASGLSASGANQRVQPVRGEAQRDGRDQNLAEG